jgi:predicted nucleic acid-binding protein
MYLLDTVALSETRKRERNPRVIAWLTEHKSEDLFLSAITIGEIRKGIELERPRNPGFAQALDLWLERVITLYAGQIAPFSVETAMIWGALSARLGHSGADLQIAATALEHGWTIVTRNVVDFERTGVRLVNPWEE